MQDNRFFLLFNTIHDVLRVEKILKKHAIRHELVPVPRDLSSDCGMSVLLYTDVREVTGLLGPIKPTGIYSFDGQGYSPADIG